MSCRDKLIPTIVIFYMLALVGFLIDSIFIVPMYTECTYINQIPEDAVVDLSMSDWIVDNMVAGIILFSLMASFGRNKRASSDCMLVIFLVIFTLYCLFQIVWMILGFLIYNQTYQEECSYSDNFSFYVMGELIYGAILFPLIFISGIILFVMIKKQEKEKNNRNIQPLASEPILNQPILNQQHTPQPQSTTTPNQNFYGNLYNRLSGSFSDENRTGIN